jgi:hypothetical protein
VVGDFFFRITLIYLESFENEAFLQSNIFTAGELFSLLFFFFYEVPLFSFEPIHPVEVYLRGEVIFKIGGELN